MSAQGRRRYIYASAALGGRCPGGVEGARGGIMDLDRDLGPGRSDISTVFDFLIDSGFLLLCTIQYSIP